MLHLDCRVRQASTCLSLLEVPRAAVFLTRHLLQKPTTPVPCRHRRQQRGRQTWLSEDSVKSKERGLLSREQDSTKELSDGREKESSSDFFPPSSDTQTTVFVKKRWSQRAIFSISNWKKTSQSEGLGYTQVRALLDSSSSSCCCRPCCLIHI